MSASIRSPSATYFGIHGFVPLMEQFTGPLDSVMEKLIADQLFFICSDYVDGPTAKADNLTYTSDNTFILRADYKNKVAAGQPGRKSVRLVSTQTFDRHVSMYVALNPNLDETVSDAVSHCLQLRC